MKGNTVILNGVWIVVLLLSSASVALGHDIAPPDWRGEDRTVYAKWDTWSNEVDASDYFDWYDPDPYPNWYPYGLQWWQSIRAFEPDAWLANPSLGGTGNSEDVPLAIFNSTINYGNFGWSLYNEHELDIYMPNHSGGARKTVRLQLTYYGTPELYGGQDFGPWWYAGNWLWIDNLDMVAYYPNGNETTVVWEFDYMPNPDSEWLSIYLGDPWSGFCYVSQVVIDTQCPEPGTLALLSVGGLALLRRRSRSGI